MLVIRAEHIYVVQCELRYTPMDLWCDCVYKVALVIAMNSVDLNHGNFAPQKKESN